MTSLESNFKIAAAFASYSQTLQLIDPNFFYGQITVVAVSHAFAAEVFLKCILTLLGSSKKGHRLVDLFNNIPEKDTTGNNPKELIRKYYDERVRKLKERLVGPGKEFYFASFSDFDQMLKINSDNFKWWRYNYEFDWSKQLINTSGVDHFCLALQKYILQLKPEWGKFTSFKDPNLVA